MSAATLERPAQRSAPREPTARQGFVLLAVQDDSLAPHLNKGDALQVEPCDSAELRSVVLVETPDGKQWIRQLRPGPDGTVTAATNGGFPEFTDFRVVARATHRWTYGSSI